MTYKYIEQCISFVQEHVPISSTDLKGIITCVSQAFCELTGYTQEELIGQKHSILRHPDTKDVVYKEMWRKITKGEVWSGRLKNKTKNGKIYWVDAFIQPVFEDEKIVGYIAVRKNITEELTYEKLAKIDPLTGLLNRYAIEEYLRFFIEETQRYDMPFSIIMIDLDDFKETNDVYGHLAGDEVLKRLSCIFQEMVRASDRIGRWGGEEFMILLPYTPYEKAFELADRLRKSFAEYEFNTIGHKTASFGVAVYESGDTLTSLAAKVDKALYSAKRNGKNRVH